MPLTAHQSLLPSPGSVPPLATWNHAGPRALSLFCSVVPKATAVQLFPCPVTNPFSEASLCGHQDNPRFLWPPQSPSATSTALPPTTPPSTEIRGLSHAPHLPPCFSTYQFMPQAPGGSLKLRRALQAPRKGLQNTLKMGSSRHPQGLRGGKDPWSFT